MNGVSEVCEKRREFSHWQPASMPSFEACSTQTPFASGAIIRGRAEGLQFISRAFHVAGLSTLLFDCNERGTVVCLSFPVGLAASPSKRSQPRDSSRNVFLFGKLALFEIRFLCDEGLRQGCRQDSTWELSRHDNPLQIARTHTAPLQFADMKVPCEDAVAQKIQSRIVINLSHFELPIAMRGVRDALRPKRADAFKLSRLSRRHGARERGLELVRPRIQVMLSATSTFSRNLNNIPIDGIFATPAVSLQAGGYFGFGEGPGLDHRCLWMDVSFQSAFGHSPPPMGQHKARRLTCEDRRVRERHNDLHAPCRF
jgi:hypothetical protein